MKINAQVKMSMVLISLMALVVSFQNCAGTTVGNPYIGENSENISAPALDSVFVQDNLSTAKSSGLSSLIFCIEKVEFQNVSLTTTTTYTLDKTFEFSLDSSKLDISPSLPASPEINAARIYIVDACSSLASASVSINGSEYSTTQSLDFYVPISIANGYYQFDFKGLADALLTATSDNDLENLIQSRDQTTLPLIETYNFDKAQIIE